VLIANSNLVPRWTTHDHFNKLDRRVHTQLKTSTPRSKLKVWKARVVVGAWRRPVRSEHGVRIGPSRNTHASVSVAPVESS
jgi:hypothetical protein